MTLLSNLLGSTFKGDASVIPGPPGIGLPINGATNQVLQKLSGADYDYTWKSKTNFPSEAYIETLSFSAGFGSNIIFDTLNNSSIYYTSAATTNTILNVRGSSTIPLNSVLAPAQSTTIVILVTNGSTPYKIDTYVKVDGVNFKTKWLNGTVPTGTANAVDVYNFTIIKNYAANFTIIGGMSKFL